MIHTFPTIYNLNEVKEVVKDRKEFVVVDKGDYTIINYVLAGEETFPPVDSWATAVLRECRGIAFDSKTGAVLNRKFHKFFNLNERAETSMENIDWNRPHQIIEKLDGSMITPMKLGDHIRWCTKMGVTDVAMQAEVYVADHPKYTSFAKHMLSTGFTPIFEWCSNKQRIVVEHAEDQLILTAARNNDTGRYFNRAGLESIAENFEIPIVRVFENTSGGIAEFVEYARGIGDGEGFVVTFDDGHMVKVKSDWYVRLHRTKDAIASERKVVDLMVNGNIDDLKPLLDPKDFDKIVQYEEDFRAATLAVANYAVDQVGFWLFNDMSKKDFALNGAKSIHPKIASVIFKLFDSDDAIAYDLIIGMISRSCGSNKAFDETKAAFFSEVEYKGLWD